MQSYSDRQKRARLFFISLGVVFILALTSVVLSRSRERRSIIGLEGSLGADSPTQSSQSGELSQSGSELHLQDFHRVEVKDGVPAWEIRAKDARYFAEAGLTHVNDATVTIFRDKRSKIMLRSNAAKLYLQGQALQKAEMEGGIQVLIDNSLQVRTEFAAYDSVKGEITSPDKVEITGSGFELRGVGMVIKVDSREISLLEEVDSSFKPGAKIPGGLLPEEEN